MNFGHAILSWEPFCACEIWLAVSEIKQILVFYQKCQQYRSKPHSFLFYKIYFHKFINLVYRVFISICCYTSHPSLRHFRFKHLSVHYGILWKNCVRVCVCVGGGGISYPQSTKYPVWWKVLSNTYLMQYSLLSKRIYHVYYVDVLLSGMIQPMLNMLLITGPV